MSGSPRESSQGPHHNEKLKLGGQTSQIPPTIQLQSEGPGCAPTTECGEPANGQAPNLPSLPEPSSRHDPVAPRWATLPPSAPHHPGKGQRWPVGATHEQPLQHNLVEGGVGSSGQKPVQLEGTRKGSMRTPGNTLPLPPNFPMNKEMTGLGGSSWLFPIPLSSKKMTGPTPSWQGPRKSLPDPLAVCSPKDENGSLRSSGATRGLSLNPWEKARTGARMQAWEATALGWPWLRVSGPSLTLTNSLR